MQESKPITAKAAPLASFHPAAAELCKRKLSYFVRTFWHIVVADPLVWEPHLDILCDEIQQAYELVIARQPKQYDLVINVPPGTSKSTVVVSKLFL